MEYRKQKRFIKHVISAPFIWLPFFFVVPLDIVIELYHRVCFPLYGIEQVRRSEYIRVDRHRLSYLGFWDKFNCMYCGYVNGWIHYVSEIAGRTEKYWCAIKHKQGKRFSSPQHHKSFVAYGDEKALTKKFGKR